MCRSGAAADSRSTCRGRDSYTPQDIPPDIFHPDISPSRTIPPPFLHGTIFAFYRHHPRIYNTKRSTVHTYRIDIAEDRLGRGVWVSANLKKNPNLVGRLGSEIRVSASFQNFALTAVGKCPRWRGTLSGREKCIWGEMSGGKCPTFWRVCLRNSDWRVFVAPQQTDARYWCSNSVRLSVRHVPVFYGNGLKYCHSFFTKR